MTTITRTRDDAVCVRCTYNLNCIIEINFNGSIAYCVVLPYKYLKKIKFI